MSGVSEGESGIAVCCVFSGSVYLVEPVVQKSVFTVGTQMLIVLSKRNKHHTENARFQETAHGSNSWLLFLARRRSGNSDGPRDRSERRM